MTHTVFIDGAAGTTGLEIRDRISDRSEFELLVLGDEHRKDETARREALNEADFAILCLPDDAAREAVALLDPASTTRIIDASSAHRTFNGWTYGFAELPAFDSWKCGRDEIATSSRVSNPGCYPTGFLALIAPLIARRLLDTGTRYSVNAVSGYSGGGNALIDRFEKDSEIAFRAYGLQPGHKHLAEMQCYAKLDYPPVFSPSVISAYRGMIVDVPIGEGDGSPMPSIEQIHSALCDAYRGSEIVRVCDLGKEPDELLLRRDAAPWDGMELFVFGDRFQARLVARLDNLGKGASGAAVQNLNLMAGLDETTGLRLPKK